MVAGGQARICACSAREHVSKNCQTTSCMEPRVCCDAARTARASSDEAASGIAGARKPAL